MDTAIKKIKRPENRKRLAEATAHYFNQLKPDALEEENALARDMMAGGSRIDFDQEI